jgi:hypothetical protein
VSSASGRKGTNPRVRAPLVRSVQCGRARWGCCCSASCRCMHEHGARRRAGVPGVPLSLRREDQPARGHWTGRLPRPVRLLFGWLACVVAGAGNELSWKHRGFFSRAKDRAPTNACGVFLGKKNGFTPYFVHRESNTKWMLLVCKVRMHSKI